MSELAATKKFSPARRPIKVFVVEDHNLVREGMLALLRNETGIVVAGDSASAEAAALMIDAAQPDIVVTDIGMDDCVFRMIRNVRRNHPQIRFIVVTAFDTDLNIEAALQAGVHGFLSKTDSSDELLDAVLQVSAGHSVYSESVKARIEKMKTRSSGDSCNSKPLSIREVEVLRLVAQGMSAKDVAKQLQISVKTVDRHKSNIMQKLNMHNQVELTRFAIRGGLVHA